MGLIYENRDLVKFDYLESSPDSVNKIAKEDADDYC